ncbi:MAG: NAD(P)/FAD-dependent oxidoreductase [Thermomicrobiales bacterium]
MHGVRPLAEPPRSAEIVVIGGGIVGAATAFWLGRAGLRPLLVERAAALATATTAASAHCIRCQFSDPENFDQMRESFDIFRAFGPTLGLSGADADIGLRQQGYLFASTIPEERVAFAARVARQQALGVDDIECFDGDEIRRRFPWISGEVAVGAFREADGWIDGYRAAAGFAKASGAVVMLSTTVTGIEIEGGRVVGVATTRGRIATERVVLAAGPFSKAITPEPLPIVLWKRNRLIVPADARIPQHGPMTIDANTGAHWRPYHGGALLAWAQDERDADPVWPVAPDPGFPDLILRDPRGVGRLSPFWNDVAPGLGPDRIQLTAGQYTVTPDHKPLIGPAAETRGLWINTGYSGHGIMGSASGGRLLADTVTGRVAEAANPFHPGRFASGAKPPDVEQIVL